MSRPRAMLHLLGASSRPLLEQFVAPSTQTAPGKLVPRPNHRVSTWSSICLSCSFTGNRRQLRLHSTKPDNAPPHPNCPPGPPPETEPLGSTTKPSSAENEPPSSTSTPNLPSHSESARSELSHRFSSFMDRAQTTLFTASQRLNDLTGYSGIETLKSQIASLESSLTNAQARHHAVRHRYQTKVSERSATQREVTTLLARQKTWTPADFERFTTLYRQDYELEAEVTKSAGDLEDAEREAEKLGRELSTGILARYHEEQIWSDKIRRMSTWGTWGLMGVNVLLFLVFQFGAEPWRRARLVRGFEQKVKEALEEEREIERRRREEKEKMRDANVTATATGSVAEPVLVDVVGAEQACVEVAVADEIPLPLDDQQPPPPLSWRETFANPERIKAAALDLASERVVPVRMRDLSLVALEGVVGGAAVAGAIAIFFIRRA
ncbi:Mdm33 family-domain-containing protein [Pseudomassariella vexata]|uniref:Sensitive to high expression protein 9, mitochondrial n=1 Tax=Pseudomassariella vexata TaxID=1141098 RepID=A0A1Y2DUE4_9PEZI|nr:Mdm33 family-domain-containing protein [Pseudomassariella vexata]ORY62891.1 Mdm33 family-domain-containing protein [Pseudomassariella vexata]